MNKDIGKYGKLAETGRKCPNIAEQGDEDIRETPRKMIGTILSIDEDIIHLKSEKTGWRASVDTSVCRVQSVCTTEGWGKLETNNELR